MYCSLIFLPLSIFTLHAYIFMSLFRPVSSLSTMQKKLPAGRIPDIHAIYICISIDICPLRAMLNFHKRSANKIIETILLTQAFSKISSKHFFKCKCFNLSRYIFHVHNTTVLTWELIKILLRVYLIKSYCLNATMYLCDVCMIWIRHGCNVDTQTVIFLE